MFNPANFPQFWGNEEEDVHMWLNRLEHYFLAVSCTDDSNRLGSALVCLQGMAFSWSLSQSFSTYDDF